MCNAKNHSAGCNCGFGPRSAGLNVTSGEYEKVTRDALAEVFPVPKMSADGKDFGNPLYNGLANDPGLSDADKAKAKGVPGKAGRSRHQGHERCAVGRFRNRLQGGERTDAERLHRQAR
ncbi:hypothetical protein [Pseudolabrys taiwanensis]|uniref:hypothetical protein n=1 Tax=Pseudolabrys taiwanensis TaxID=331696 RepID=UPI0013B3CDF8|nr:hypothetical protein [Pseudolabrys taiwanensis]